jgi:formate dehydrogenase iron-sulfur subunit
VADIFRTRVLSRGKGSEVWGWGTAYGKPSQGGGAPTEPKPATTGVKS